MALRIGTLVRGGYSFGQLYHENNVVFGEAMVDAYKIERDIAIFPRIVVSDRILKRLDGIPESDRDFLLQDTDGRWHLNYFSSMIQHSTNGPIEPEHAKRWRDAHMSTIDLAIAQNNGRVREKWEWFKRQFDLATATIPEAS